MIDPSSSSIQHVAVHYIGNKTNGEELIVSKTLLPAVGKQLEELLLHYFLTPFAQPEYHHFTFSNGDCNMNPLYQYAAQIFDSPVSFHTQTVNIAKHLYETADHPNIKPGDLFIVRFNDVSVDGERREVTGIFKSEHKQSFLKLYQVSGQFDLEPENGINVDKLDKGCLIINSDREQGFKVCVLDKGSKSEAQYWKDHFLQLRSCNDDYHQTKELLTIAKNFVTTQFPEDFEVTRADQIDMLNRSMEYFKTHDTFEKDNFEQEVFQDERIIRSFRNFDESYREEHEVDVSDHFDISAPAVKKQSRVFKSVLKLDKNFHIYIHGDRELIEQGTDPDGRKFYKLYFEEEA